MKKREKRIFSHIYISNKRKRYTQDVVDDDDDQ